MHHPDRLLAPKLIMLCAMLTSPLMADPIGLDAFSGSETLIDFELIASRHPITDQFAAQGLTFDPGLFGDPAPGSSINGSREATNYSVNTDIYNPIVAHFQELQFRVGFFAAGGSNEGSILLQAFRSDVLIEGATFQAHSILPGGNLRSVFAGLEIDGGFDRVEISRLDSNRAFSIDDLRFEPIPSPGAFVPFTLAIFVKGRRARRGQVARRS